MFAGVDTNENSCSPFALPVTKAYTVSWLWLIRTKRGRVSGLADYNQGVIATAILPCHCRRLSARLGRT